MNPRLKKFAVLAVVMTLAASACSTGDKSEPSAGGTSETPTSPTPPADSSILRIKDKGVTAKGGTVHVVQTYDFESLDPANNYMTNSTEVGRLIYRSLTFIDDTPGEDPTIQPDLAESLGTPSDDGRTWTYKLREGIKFEDGRPITAQDVKYGVMRSFESDVFSLGATWMPDLLANDTDFKGPYATPDKDLTSVETPDDRTLVFHFSGPQPDADWIMSLTYTAPVPKDSDTKEDYGNRPIASGPYKIADYQRGKSLELVRNENWDAATDPNRPAYPDRFQFELDADEETASQRLLDGKGDDAFAVPLDGVLKVGDYPKVEDPAVKPRFINGPGACVDNITMNTQKIKDPDVRHAIALSIDRQGIQTINGGDLYGSIADSIVPANLPGFVAPDLGLAPNGDPAAAKKLLEGKSVPPLHIGISDEARPSTKDRVSQVTANLKAVGIELVTDVIPDADFLTVMDGDGATEISFGGWCFDWPTAASIVLPLLGPDEEGTSWGSNNSAKFFDPKFSDELQKLRSSTGDSAAIAKQAVDLANEIQTSAWPYLPTVSANDPEVVGANITNVGISPVFSQVDLNTLAVKQ